MLREEPLLNLGKRLELGVKVLLSLGHLLLQILEQTRTVNHWAHQQLRCLVTEGAVGRTSIHFTTTKPCLSAE